MKRTHALLLLVTTLTLAAACASAPDANRAAGANTNARPAPAATPAAPTPPADELAAARNTYMQFCTRCHRPDGSGGPFEVDGGKKLDVPSLREGHALTHSDEDFVEQIMDGGDGMPAFKTRLDPDRVNGLVRFIRQEIQGKTATGGASSNKPAPAPAH